jgi:HEAT repeat protein
VLPGGIPVRGTGIDDVAGELRVRSIQRLRIHRDLEPAELLGLIDALAQSADEQAAAGGLEQVLQRAGVQHITTSEIDFAEHFRRFAAPDVEPEERALELKPEAMEACAPTESEPKAPEIVAAPEPEAGADPLRSQSISQLTKLLAQLESCEAVVEYSHLSDQITAQVAEMTRAKNALDAYRAVLVYCRHSSNTSGRPAAICREAESRLRAFAEDPMMLQLVLEHACGGEGLSSVQAIQVLVALGPQAVPDLLKRYEEGDASVQRQVTAILIAMGDGAFPVIVDELASTAPERARRAVRLLGRMQNPRGVDFLLDRLLDPSEELRQEVARALARIGTERAVEGLIEAANQFPELAPLVASCLGETRNEAALQGLVRMLQPKAKYSDEVQREAIRSLGRIGSTIALATLAQILDRSPYFFKIRGTRMLRLAAAQAIGRIGGDEAAAVLSAQSRRGDPAVRKACRQALERIARAEVL